jgi:ParB family chromosome partitioning protein
MNRRSGSAARWLCDHLTHEEIDAGRDALAKFVGVQVYEQAGGSVRRDLFADEQSGIFLTDAALLESLAKERIAPVAERVQAAGWGWADMAPRATYADLHQFQRMRSKRREPNKAEAKRIAKLEAQQGKLHDRLDDETEDMTDEQAQAVQDEMDTLGNELEAIERSLVVYPLRTMVTAGAVVLLDRIGGVIVHRGLLREEQAKTLRQRAAESQARHLGEAGEAPQCPSHRCPAGRGRPASARRTGRGGASACLERHP